VRAGKAHGSRMVKQFTQPTKADGHWRDPVHKASLEMKTSPSLNSLPGRKPSWSTFNSKPSS
jgi:hypothetical protein